MDHFAPAVRSTVADRLRQHPPGGQRRAIVLPARRRARAHTATRPHPTRLTVPTRVAALVRDTGGVNVPTAMRAIAAVLAPGAPFLFTTHDRDEPDELHLWRAEAKRWAAGTQDPRLHEYGDRYFEHEHGRTFMHLPTRDEMLAELAATGWVHEYDIMRNDLARESHAVRDFSDNCRFWLARRR